jgi:hypothetical protein
MTLVRRDSGIYYYENYRTDGRKVCRYVGSGLVAVLCARLDDTVRGKEALRKEQERAERQKAEAEDREFQM